MTPKLLVAVAILLPFTAWSTLVIVDHGYLGFIELALREPWAMQMLLDLSISLGLFATFAIPDAKKHGIVVWPYLVASVFLGSIGSLAYVIHREVARRSAPATATAQA